MFIQINPWKKKLNRLHFDIETRETGSFFDGFIYNHAYIIRLYIPGGCFLEHVGIE